MCVSTPVSIYDLRNIIGPVTLATLKAHYTSALCRLTWDLLPTSTCSDLHTSMETKQSYITKQNLGSTVYF